MSEAHANDKRTLLIEIGTEDLPPGATLDLFGATLNLPKLWVRLHDKLIDSHFIDDDHVIDDDHDFVLFTPRRLAVKIKNVATHQPTQTVERKGPPATEIDGDDPKVRGFAKSCKVEIGQLEIRDGRLFCHAETGGRSLAAVLPELLPVVLNQANVSSRMRWGAGDHTFVRPVRWLCVVYGKEVIDCELFGLKSGRITYGHRFHHPQELVLEHADEYEKKLKDEGRVIVNFDTRWDTIKEQVPQASPELLHEATASTEWPQVLTATFDKAFLSLPPEVITQTLEHALKVFPRKDEKGQLLPEFAIVADIESKSPQTIVHGYENIVRARLDDAKFFFEQDKKTSLEARRPVLERTLFREGLGTLADKAKRLEKLAAFLAPHCGASSEHAQRAAQLCKCDLGTDLVGEYPELQGIMGGYYAAADGEHEAVAAAIREHYLPQGRDDMPTSPAGVALAIADKADTLAGFWSVKLTPSGSKDPYGLRRAACGILRILIKREIDFDIEPLIGEAASEYSGNFKKRLCGYMREQLCSDIFVWSFEQYADITHDCINAVVNVVLDNVVLKKERVRPSDFFSRLKAVDSFLANPAADSLIAANKRIRNILEKTEVRATKPDVGAMTEDAERDLFKAVEVRRKTFNRQFDAQDYIGAMKTLAELRSPIDYFFDEVMVMSENEKERYNRLALLYDIRGMFLKIADFSKLNLNRPEATK